MVVTSSAERVLIVGAGPAGLFAACELARHGIPTRLVERRVDPHREARATAIQPAVLEVLGRAGVLQPFLDAGVPVRRVRVIGPNGEEIAASTFDGIGCLHEHQCSLPQWRTEQILNDHLEKLGGRVERGVEVLAVEDAEVGLTVTLLHADGRTEQVPAQYVLGAGGAHSITRTSIHGTLEGATYIGEFVAADVRTDLPIPPEEARLFLGPQGLVLLAPLPDHRWIMFVGVGEVADTPPDEAQLAALVNQRLGHEAGIHDARWINYFRMHNRIAPRLSEGRRFLLGDAGHLSSPLAGEGLNSALMDAADIAWKLALVLQGSARPILLDSYAIERSLADHHVLDVSDRTHRHVMDLLAMLAQGQVPEPDAPDAARDLAGQRTRAMLDVSYAGSPLVGDHPPGARSAEPAPGSRFPDRARLAGTRHHLLVFGTADLEPLRRRWSGLVEILDGAASGFDATRAGVSDGGAVLIRPDGMIGFRASPADGLGLAALDAHLASYLVPKERTAAAIDQDQDLFI
ncbi:MAG TPA: FAD-dependent monooxygenase [Geminicoccus sp.]|jgi:2-polyprenyl-6-methoxyphenol hydroxylase-like FAD-dependent oxidoreductase|uniref:FAD-dependent monooxygenase n=1 Tax=Geminicoccus sp. TaxID=2024832 RepID=UPI002E34ED7D|nr:FAD-dependent monooxygenase [Geminicoccus sp.]HEX2526617.1 FAD-dependent monooxygenase [Geminicoccus sp.]